MALAGVAHSCTAPVESLQTVFRDSDVPLKGGETFENRNILNQRPGPPFVPHIVETFHAFLCFHEMVILNASLINNVTLRITTVESAVVLCYSGY